MFKNQKKHFKKQIKTKKEERKTNETGSNNAYVFSAVICNFSGSVHYPPSFLLPCFLYVQ